MRAAGLPVPARDARQAMGDVGDLDIERRGVEQIEPPPRQHPLPGAGGDAAIATFFVPSFGLEAGLAKFAAAVLVAEAGDQMVVDHAGGLHEGVDDGRADEFEAARAELL